MRLQFKYRLKLLDTLQRHRGAVVAQFTIRPHKALRRMRRRRARNKHSLLRRARSLTSTRILSKEYAFRVRPVHSPRQ